MLLTCCLTNWSVSTFATLANTCCLYSKTSWFCFIGTNSLCAASASPVYSVVSDLIFCWQKWLQWAFFFFIYIFFLLRPCCLNFFHANLLFRLLLQIEVCDVFRCSTDHFFLRSSPASPKLWGPLNNSLFKIVFFLPVLRSFFSYFPVTQSEVAKGFVSHGNGQSFCCRALSGYLASSCIALRLFFLSFLSEPVGCRPDRKSQIRICILTAPFTVRDDEDTIATLLCTRVLHACVASFFTLMDS